LLFARQKIFHASPIIGQRKGFLCIFNGTAI
jgi:hypothetical protein